MMSARLRSVKVVELHSTENMRLFSYFFKQKIKKDHFSNKDMRKNHSLFPFLGFRLWNAVYGGSLGSLKILWEDHSSKRIFTPEFKVQLEKKN